MRIRVSCFRTLALLGLVVWMLPGRVSAQEERLAQALDNFLVGFMQSPCDTDIAPIDNEVHDCQRLIREPRSRSDPLDFGILAGILPDVSVISLPASAYDEPRMVARVSNAGALSGAEGYAPLGITEQVSADGAYPAGQCLWLHFYHGVWRARWTDTESPGSPDCELPRTVLGAEWDSLEVRRQTYGNALLDAYPNTARWEWTSESGESIHYIGVKCGAAWCSIGRRGFIPDRLPQPYEQADPTKAIPGWHDSQFLAFERRSGPGNSTLVPGPWGTVYPEPVPDSDDPRWQTGVRAASFEIGPGPSGPLGAYVSKLNLRAPPTSNAPHTSWVEVSWSGNANQNPEARYRNSQGGATKQATAVITGPYRHGPAKSARWRWHDDDETAWVPCPRFGCCDVQEGQN